MSDLDLDLLRDWSPERFDTSGAAREHALGQLELLYGGDPAPAPRAHGRGRFGRRFAIAIALVTAVAVVGFLWAQREVDDRIASINTVDLPRGDLGPGSIGRGPVNVLLVGSDRRDGSNVEAFGTPAEVGTIARADTIVLVQIDRSNVRAVWLPRDLVVDGTRINRTFEQGPAALVGAIRTSLGVSVDHYVAVEFTGFERIIDELGGVPVYSPGPVRDTTSGVDLPDAGCHTLDGAAALGWVRSRHLQIKQNGVWMDASPRADLDRIARQQAFVRSLAVTAKSAIDGDPVKAVRLATALLPSLTVDSTFSRAEIVRLAEVLTAADLATAQFTTIPTQVAADHASLELDQSEAPQVLEPFRSRSAPSPASVRAAAGAEPPEASPHAPPC